MHNSNSSHHPIPVRIYISVISMVILCLAGIMLCPCASAEEEVMLHIEVVALPDGLIEPGDVKLSFTINNISDADAHNVYLSSGDGLTSVPLGEIPSGESLSFTREHSVTAQELDAGEVNYTVSHDDPDNADIKINYSVNVVIHRSSALPDVEFTRRFSTRNVEAGDGFIITYSLRNTGNVELTNLQVQDSLGNFTGHVELLEVGDTRTLINRTSVTEATVSSATLSYRSYGDSQIHEQALEDATVGIAVTGLEASFTADHSAFSPDVANLVLILRNTGNVDYRDLCVIDDIYGGVIADEMTLAAYGEQLEISCACELRGELGFRWRVIAVSETGKPLDYITQTLYMPPLESSSTGAFSLTVQPLMPRIRRSGNVKFHVRINNEGSVELRDLVLSEAERGEVHRFAVLGTNSVIERDISFFVDEDMDFSFQVDASAANGEPVSAQAEVVSVVIDPEGELPEGAKDTLVDFTGGSIKIGGSSTFAYLLLGGFALLLILSVALIVVTHRTHKAEHIEHASVDEEKKYHKNNDHNNKDVQANHDIRPRKNEKDR